jgi:hypothetical protein
MDTTQELIEVYHLLRHQQQKIRDLHLGVRAIVEALKSPQGAFSDDYDRTYEDPGSRGVTAEYDSTIRIIDAKVQRLRDGTDQ